MDLQQSLEAVTARLLERGITEEEMAKPIAKLRQYMLDNWSEEFALAMQDEDEIGDLVDNITELVEKRRERRRAIAEEQTSQTTAESTPTSAPGSEPLYETETEAPAANAAVQQPVYPQPQTAQPAVRQQIPVPAAQPQGMYKPQQTAPQPVKDAAYPPQTARPAQNAVYPPQPQSTVIQPPPSAPGMVYQQPVYPVAPASQRSAAPENAESTRVLNDLSGANNAADSDAATRTLEPVPKKKKAARKKEELSLYEDVQPIGQSSVSHLDPDALDDSAYIRGSGTFWTLFILTLPITGAILGALSAVFVALFAAMAVLIVSLIALLIGIIVGGSALSLIGIIYGITQTFTVVPVGLYEIGLGIVIGGLALLIGILTYNAAVRLLPWLSRELYEFFCFCWKQVRRLFRYLKKESMKA